MFRILLLNALLLSFFCASSQNSNCLRPVKHAIGSTGCHAYFNAQPDEVEESSMDDGAQVFTTSAVCNNVTYGILLVKFNTDVPLAERDTLLMSFMDVIKDMGNIVNSAGYGRGHRHDQNPDALGIIDYAEDASGHRWEIKGWVDGNYVAIMYIVLPEEGADELAPFNLRQLFLNGFRFPE
jgi:hypothetical protein